MRNLLRLQLRRNAVFLAAVMIVLAAFEFLLCAVVASMDIEAAFGQMTALAPPMLRAIIEQNMPGGTPAGVLSFGWNHPVAHALLTAVAIALPARAIAGEIENGAIELVMTEPLSRAEYFTAQALFGAGAIASVVLAGMLGTVVGQQVYSLKAFDASQIGRAHV